MIRVEQVRKLLGVLEENPRAAPRLVLRKAIGFEPWKFGWQAVPNTLAKALHRRIPGRESGTCIWETEWDLLVIVDSCRPEWMDRVASEYPWISEVDAVRSVGSHSDEWVEKTFTAQFREEIENTIYVTGNPYSTEGPTEWFHRFEDVVTADWAIDSYVPPAHVVTDRAVAVTRAEDWDRCIVHYMQPHKPILERGESRRDVHVDQQWQPTGTFWRQYIDGHVTKAELEDAFVSNLEYVLAEVDTLLANVDAPTAVVTSDHGQALGERYLWSHRRGVDHPAMRQVPWVACRATDDRTLVPEEYTQVTDPETQKDGRLEALGYR